MGKASRNKAKHTSIKQPNMTQVLAEDLNQFKIRTSHKLMNLELLSKEAKKDGALLAKAFSAILDLMVDSSRTPKNVLIERFLFYCQEKELVVDGKVKGEAVVSAYNF